jgi:hypothetical protein
VHDSSEFFKEMHDIKVSFRDMFESLDNLNANKYQLAKLQKIYFDNCHISPIKMHLSFSLAGDLFKDATFLLDNPFFQSIGFALTDMQDIVFK